jgi:hypothetical protein
VFVRFVPHGQPDETIVRELATCLRMIECREDTPRVVPDELLAGVYGAWERARADVFDEWMTQTDPANLQVRVPPFNRELADFLRTNLPSGSDPERLSWLIGALEAPLPRREEVELRRVFGAGYPGNRAKADAIVGKVEELGLEPVIPPEPLKPIENEEVHLICWMVIEKDNGRIPAVAH